MRTMAAANMLRCLLWKPPKLLQTRFIVPGLFPSTEKPSTFDVTKDIPAKTDLRYPTKKLSAWTHGAGNPCPRPSSTMLDIAPSCRTQGHSRARGGPRLDSSRPRRHQCEPQASQRTIPRPVLRRHGGARGHTAGDRVSGGQPAAQVHGRGDRQD